jgi:4-hydroxy-3-methylbut-2-enyl diphosphate reductase IspH
LVGLREEQRQKQIPFGDDNQKCNNNGKTTADPYGMTNKKRTTATERQTTATAAATAKICGWILKVQDEAVSGAHQDFEGFVVGVV